MEDVDEAEDEDGGHVEGQGDQEHEEVPVVTSTCQNARINKSSTSIIHTVTGRSGTRRSTSSYVALTKEVSIRTAQQ